MSVTAEDTSHVVRNYATDGLAQAILAMATEVAGGPPTVNHLSRFDHFHMGGTVATSWVVEAVNPGPGADVLDVGSGFGGPARQLATAGELHVTGVDLTPQHVDGATELSRAVGLQSRTTFVLGDATRLPFGAAAFDAAMMLFVGMNVAVKPELFSQVRRVLQPGARFVVYDPMRSGADHPAYPVPWAADQARSSIEQAAAYREALERAGFELESEQDRSTEVLRLADEQAAKSGGRAEIGRLQVQFGDEGPVRSDNLVRAIRDGVVECRLLVARAR